MSDLGSFQVQASHLRTEGDEWQGRADQLTKARALVAEGSQQGYNFGFFATQAGLSRMHDGFISDMLTAVDDGHRTFEYLKAALHSAANAYDGADDTAASSAEHLRKRLDP